MKLTIYKCADDFLEENRLIMEQHSIPANLIWINALSQKTVEDGFFGASVADGDNVYLAIMTTPFPMVHFSVGGNKPEMAELLYNYLFERNILPEKISGAKDTVDVFKNIANKRDVGYEESRYLHLRECNKVNDISTVGGEYQSPITIDFDFGPWLTGFIRDCELEGASDNASERAKQLIDNGNLACYLANNKVVTMAAQTRKVKGGRCVGMVYTPNELRGNGYSIACMKYLTQEILDDGNTVAYLYSDKYNAVSNHVYEKIGYKITGDFMEYNKA